jgi:hypothetical protein
MLVAAAVAVVLVAEPAVEAPSSGTTAWIAAALATAASSAAEVLMI